MKRSRREKRQPKGDYPVGYARPPEHTRFPHQKNLNRRGRRKKDFPQLLHEALYQTRAHDRKRTPPAYAAPCGSRREPRAMELFRSPSIEMLAAVRSPKVARGHVADGHLVSFDRRKCKAPRNGPQATDEHGCEGSPSTSRRGSALALAAWLSHSVAQIPQASAQAISWPATSIGLGS